MLTKMLCLQKGDQATGDFIVAVRTLTHIPNTTAYCICVWRTEMFAHEKSQHFVHLFRCGLSQESKGFQADATLLFCLCDTSNAESNANEFQNRTHSLM